MIFEKKKAILYFSLIFHIYVIQEKEFFVFCFFFNGHRKFVIYTLSNIIIYTYVQKFGVSMILFLKKWIVIQKRLIKRFKSDKVIYIHIFKYKQHNSFQLC